MRGPTDPQRRTSPVAGTNRRPAPPKSLPGVAGFKSERWPTSNRNGGPASGRKGGRHQIGKGGRLASESALNIKTRQTNIAERLRHVRLGHVEKLIRARFSLFSLCHHNLPI
jgi:hypothetical protein